MPFLMELDDAVRVMARGIARGKPTVALPMAVLARWLTGVPRWIYEPLAARSRLFRADGRACDRTLRVSSACACAGRRAS